VIVLFGAPVKLECSSCEESRQSFALETTRYFNPEWWESRQAFL